MPGALCPDTKVCSLVTGSVHDVARSDVLTTNELTGYACDFAQLHRKTRKLLLVTLFVAHKGFLFDLAFLCVR